MTDKQSIIGMLLKIGYNQTFTTPKSNTDINATDFYLSEDGLTIIAGCGDVGDEDSASVWEFTWEGELRRFFTEFIHYGCYD